MEFLSITPWMSWRTKPEFFFYKNWVFHLPLPRGFQHEKKLPGVLSENHMQRSLTAVVAPEFSLT